MMNTYKKIFAVLVLVVITISACSPQSEATSDSSTPSNSTQSETTRDLSSPSKIIVGHWRSAEDWQDGLEWYFGEFDENGTAQCFHNTTLNYVESSPTRYELTPYGELMPFTCQINKEEEKKLWVEIITEDGISFRYNQLFTPGKYGKRLMIDPHIPLFYVDSNTEP
jgi:hypothetical protein